MAQNDNNDSKKSVTGKIDRILFLDSKTGRSILSVVREDGKSCRVIGNINGIEKDSYVTATGAWRKDEKYGWQFMAESIEEISQTESEEPVEDGLMHALDFSNVLNKKHKEFRKVLLECDDFDEDDEDDIEFDSEYVSNDGNEAEMDDGDTIVVDGTIYNKDMTKLISVSKHITSFDIPESVTIICDRAFQNCYNLCSVIIPDSVENIGIFLFDHCTKLTSIRFPKRDLDGYVFYDCPELCSIEIPGVETIVNYDEILGCKYIQICRQQPTPKKRERITIQPTECITNKTVDVSWEDVLFLNGSIRIPNQLGGYMNIADSNVDTSINSLKKHLARLLPNLTVHFDFAGNATIVNIKELHDVVITLKIKNNLASLIKSGQKPSEILKQIDTLSKEHIREFIPRDMTPYINYLLERHAADRYPIVPIVEYIGGRREEGALYTIMIDGQPNIVWENNNDARSTYVFPCTEEKYIETRQRIFDYIMAEEKGKRVWLHTDECTSLFAEKPRMVVHNNLASWSQRLMKNE